MNGRLEPCQSQNAITESKNQAVSEWKLVSSSDASCSHCSSSWSWNVYVTWIDGIPAKILKALVAQSVNAGLTTLRSLVRIQPVTGRAHYKLYKCSFLGSWALWECLSDSLSHIGSNILKHHSPKRHSQTTATLWPQTNCSHSGAQTKATVGAQTKATLGPKPKPSK